MLGRDRSSSQEDRLGNSAGIAPVAPPRPASGPERPAFSSTEFLGTFAARWRYRVIAERASSGLVDRKNGDKSLGVGRWHRSGISGPRCLGFCRTSLRGFRQFGDLLGKPAAGFFTQFGPGVLLHPWDYSRRNVLKARLDGAGGRLGFAGRHSSRQLGFPPAFFDELPRAHPVIMVTALGSAFGFPDGMSDAGDLVG
jgi:hypothetical protein